MTFLHLMLPTPRGWISPSSTRRFRLKVFQEGREEKDRMYLPCRRSRKPLRDQHGTLCLTSDKTFPKMDPQFIGKLNRNRTLVEWL